MSSLAVLFPLGRLCMIVALCVSIGGHWAALQSVAWATMLIDNAQRAPLARAIEQTFDGKHPCDLCKRVVAEQHSQKKSDTPVLKAKPDLICATRSITLLPPSSDLEFAGMISSASSYVSSPPTPPPRLALAG